MTNLKIRRDCLIFFVDETGHERFSDPSYPVFGLEGCAILAANVEAALRQPWRTMKAEHFGGADTPLHAADLRNPTREQMEALGCFFREQSFGRFAVTMTNRTALPSGSAAYEYMPAIVRRRWMELIERLRPAISEVALVHEESERGDVLVERYFGKTAAWVNEEKVPVHHALMSKSSVPELEVADFIVHTAGAQTRAELLGRKDHRKDFQAVFHANSAWTTIIHVKRVELTDHPDQVRVSGTSSALP